MIIYKYVSSVSALSSLVVMEMVARVAKHELMSKWREMKSPRDLDHQKICIDYFNLLLGNGPVSTSYWIHDLTKQVIGFYLNF